MYKIFTGALVLLFAFVGCTSYFEKGYHPEVLEEKKIQATRKTQTIKNEAIDLVVLITYLNEIEYSYYDNLCYFFVEIYAPSQEPLNFKRLHIELSGDNKNTWHQARYMRLLSPKEYDRVLKPVNKWSNCYLVAFDKVNFTNVNSALVRLWIDEEEKFFDFSFEVIPFQML